jgi:membrane associated rhomboid family serine protease
MIPIRDDTPTYSTPSINYLLIALNTVVFLYQQFVLPPEAQSAFVSAFALVPIKVEAALGLVHVHAPSASALPLLTSMFLHAGWWHLIGNMWVLWIFGDNIEDYLGHFPYLVFYLISGLSGSLLHIFFNPHSAAPSVGASGAIAGVMGAYFVLFPAARVLTLVPLIIFFTFVWLPAWIVLGFWFVMQFLGGAASSIAYSSRGGGIAFWAHVGGFVAGIVMVKLMPQRMHRRARYTY